jgi:hypothetical protein
LTEISKSKTASIRISIYGGVHDDPGSRRKFTEELAKQKTPPLFVAVEWEKSVFEKFVQWRPWIEEQLASRWDFLTRKDCQELALALAWEGDAYAEIFPGTGALWLEAGFQEAALEQRFGRRFPESIPQSLAWRLCHIAPPEPRSRRELVDRAWKTAWSNVWEENGDFDRDARWAAVISERSSRLIDGWIAVVVGWQHADPAGDNRRLRALLQAEGFSVHAIRLGPQPYR